VPSLLIFNPVPILRSPSLVCAVPPVLIGAATLPPGGVWPGSLQARIAQLNTNEKLAAAATNAIPLKKLGNRIIFFN